MDKFNVKVIKTIDKYGMIESGQTVLAAVSGGYDSLCMLYSLNEIKKIRGFELAVMHFNHDFRAEADGDESFVRITAEQLRLKFYSKKVNVEKYAVENGISFETAGRELRYKYFDEIKSGYNNAVIATAHNANDSAESFLMHLMRGSGMNGLTGIAPVRGSIIRPLIEITREEIEAYCGSRGIVPVTDVTNECDDYTRNDIRHNVLPHITKRCSIDSLLRTMEILRADNNFFEQYVKSIAKNYISEYNSIIKIVVRDFNTLDTAVRRRLLYNALKQRDRQIGLTHIDDIIKLSETNRGGSKLILPGGIKIIIKKGMLEIYE